MKCFLRVTEGTLTNCALIGTGLGAVGQKIMDPVSPSHQLCWAWAAFRGHVTPADRVRRSSCGLPPLLVYGELVAFDVVLYKKKNTNTSHTHRMSADCYFFVSHHAHRFLEMISGYLENKTLWFCCKKLQWTEIARRIYEWKISFWKMQYLF